MGQYPYAMITRASLGTRVIRLKSLIRRPLLTMYALQGQINDGSFTTLLADDGDSLDYFRCLVYGNHCDTFRKGVVSSLGARRLGQSNADLVIVATNRSLAEHYRNAGFHIVPKHVKLRLPINGSPDEIIAGLPPSAREDIRRNLRRAQADAFTCEVTHDEAWFDTFYNRMYAPFAAQRHGCLAIVYPYSKVKELFSLGAGMVIKKDGEPVGAALFRIHNSNFETPFLGVMGGDVSMARDGICLALYYNAIRLAYEYGCSSVDFGYSRPFLSDGSLRYKLKWGMIAEDTNVHVGVYAIFVPGTTEASRYFGASKRFFELTPEGVTPGP
jgi:hypothetical protein